MQRIREGLAATDVAEFATRKITVWKSAPKQDEAVCRDLDMWCPALYINVECDENNHVNYPEGYKELRNKDITDVYSDQVVFHSFNPHDPVFSIDDEIKTIVQLFSDTKAKRSANPQDWANKIEADKIKIAAAKAERQVAGKEKKTAKRSVRNAQAQENEKDQSTIAKRRTPVKSRALAKTPDNSNVDGQAEEDNGKMENRRQTKLLPAYQRLAANEPLPMQPLPNKLSRRVTKDWKAPSQQPHTHRR